MDKKILHLDLETSTKDINTAGIIQISGIIEINNEEKETFNIRCQPFPQDIVNKESLEVVGISLNQIRQYQKPAYAFIEFINILSKYVNKYDKKDKFYLLAYSSVFDSSILRNWFIKNGDDYYGSWFRNPALCVMQLLAWENFFNSKIIESYKLGEVSRTFLEKDIEEGCLHDANFDVKLSKELFKKLSEKRALTNGTENRYT